MHTPMISYDWNIDNSHRNKPYQFKRMSSTYSGSIIDSQKWRCSHWNGVGKIVTSICKSYFYHYYLDSINFWSQKRILAMTNQSPLTHSWENDPIELRRRLHVHTPCMHLFSDKMKKWRCMQQMRSHTHTSMWSKCRCWRLLFTSWTLHML